MGPYFVPRSRTHIVKAKKVKMLGIISLRLQIYTIDINKKLAIKRKKRFATRNLYDCINVHFFSFGLNESQYDLGLNTSGYFVR